MFKSILLAGFFWATANVLPQSPLGPPTAAAHPVSVSVSAAPAGSLSALPAAAMPAPVLLASVPRPSQTPQVRQAWDLPIPAPAAVDADPTSVQEQAFVVMINAERSQRGLNTLTLDPMLTQTARAHSQEMCDQDYFNHHSPTPGLSTPMDRYLSALKQLGGTQPEYLLVGENIYYCSVYNDIYNVDYAHRALMASPGHRANILESRFAKVGIGIYHNAKGEFWVTEMFSRDTNP